LSIKANSLLIVRGSSTSASRYCAYSNDQGII
jgi:hypothetical protein